MARVVDRIWVRFGLWIAATVLLTIGILVGSMFLFSDAQYREFQRSLPGSVRHELDELVENDQGDSPRAIEIYGQYWKGDLLFGEKWSLLVGFIVCLPVGLLAGFLVSRSVTLPLRSMAFAAQRVARGDFAIRAEPGRQSGEMAEMIGHFNGMTDSLQRLERERKTTAAAISHELRTPLAILHARLHAVCDGVIAPSAEEFKQLLDQVEDLGRLVNDLHVLSLVDAGQLPLNRGQLDLVELARDTLKRHGLRLAQANIQSHFVTRFEALEINADKDRVRQVVSNLIENVLRHARDGGWLELAIDQVTHANGVVMAVLNVSDAGPGLAVVSTPAEMGRVSEGKPARADDRSGLGLAIVAMLVAQHGGQMASETSARGGTRFTIRLPVLNPSPTSI